MSYLTYFSITFTNAQGQPVNGELRAFLPHPIAMPDGSLVQPHEVTFPLANGVPTMPDGSAARIISTEVGTPKVRIPFKLVDADTGKETPLGDAIIPDVQTVVKLASVLNGELPA